MAAALQTHHVTTLMVTVTPMMTVPLSVETMYWVDIVFIMSFTGYCGYLACPSVQHTPSMLHGRCYCNDHHYGGLALHSLDRLSLDLLSCDWIQAMRTPALCKLGSSTFIPFTLFLFFFMIVGFLCWHAVVQHLQCCRWGDGTLLHAKDARVV